MSIVEQTKHLVRELSEAGQSLADSAAELVSDAADSVGESISAVAGRVSSVFDGSEQPASESGDAAGDANATNDNEADEQ